MRILGLPNSSHKANRFDEVIDEAEMEEISRPFDIYAE